MRINSSNSGTTLVANATPGELSDVGYMSASKGKDLDGEH